MKQKFFLLLLFISLRVIGDNNNFVIRGIVVNYDTKIPESYSRIFVYGKTNSSHEIICDTFGRFSIEVNINDSIELNTSDLDYYNTEVNYNRINRNYSDTIYTIRKKIIENKAYYICGQKRDITVIPVSNDKKQLETSNYILQFIEEVKNIDTIIGKVRYIRTKEQRYLQTNK